MAPILTTERLWLRPWEEKDVTPLHRILLNEAVMRYYPPGDPTRTRVVLLIARQLLHWAHHRYGWWAVEERDKPGILCGWCGLQYLPETGETEVAYLLDEPCWGRGLGTEGARAAIDYGFTETSLNSIIGLTHQQNNPSGRVLIKSGLTYVEKKKYFGMTCNRYLIEK